MPKQQKNNNNKSSEEKRRRKSLNKMNNNNKKRKKQQQYYNNYKNRSRASSSSITTSADIINDNTPYVSIFKEHYLPPPSSSLNNNNNQSTNNNSSSNSNNLQQKNLHGYYFDSERNRYFPIPKNGLERSISKLVNLPPPSSLKMYSSSFLENNKVSSFNKNVINNNNTLINRKKSLFTTKLKQSLFTNIKKDFTFCNLKYYLNENNFKLLEDVSKENLQVFHFENKIYSSSTQNTMFILTELKEEEDNIDDEKRLSVRQQIMLNCSTKIANSTVMDINEDNVKILISEMGGNYKSGSLNLLTFKSPFHFNTQNIYNVNKRTIYCHSINRNNLCSIGLTKGGIVYNLENKKIINYLNSNYSDIIVQKWINEDELIYSDRNSNFYLWDKRNKKEESFKNENEWINDICILNDNQWIVKSVSKSQNQMNMYCYDKRKLNQSIMTYEIPKNQLVMKNLLQDCKLFILNNKWLMLGSETIDEKSILRIWDIYNGKLELSLTNDNDWEGPITNIASLSTANNNEMLFLGMNNGIAYSTQPLIL